MSGKIIFLDIDGTLTEPGSNVPPESALRAIEGAHRAGNYVFLCSGRNYGMLSPLLAYDFDGYIGSSGGYVVCRGRVIYDCPMTDAQQKRVIGTLEKEGIFKTVECRAGSFTDEGFKDFLAQHAAEEGNSELLRWRRQVEQSLDIRPMSEYGGQPIYKVVAMSPGMDRVLRAKKALEDEFNFIIQDTQGAGIVNGEVQNRAFDKGTGVKKVAQELGIPLQDTIGYGDSMNDLEMIQTVGLSVCMANGSDALKAHSDEVCPAVTEDGLWKSFRTHGLMQ